MTRSPLFFTERARFHASLLGQVLSTDDAGKPTNADGSNAASVAIAAGILRRIGESQERARVPAQTSGKKFEEACGDFVRATFTALGALRPGVWNIRQVGGRNRLAIAEYDQFSHLIALDKAAKSDPELAAVLGNDYTITPDVVVERMPEPDEVINSPNAIVDGRVAQFSSLRSVNQPRPLLHASISCKWTLRSDRAQNARSEALNLIRNRKGRVPHIVVLTGEPLPSRIASLALGTGDLDCIYHFALPELVAAVEESDYHDARDSLQIMISGRRLRDIADLPLDLAV